jgi:hypothetical protein
MKENAASDLGPAKSSRIQAFFLSDRSWLVVKDPPIALARPLAALLPQRGLELSFFSFRWVLPYCGRSAARWKGFAGRHRAATASHALRRLADGLREEHDEAAEPQPTFASCHLSGQ